MTSPVGSDGSSGHAGDEFQHGRPARASVNLFAFAALLLEAIAFIVLIPILTTEPAFSCFSGLYRQWLTRMQVLYVAAFFMIPLGLILAIVGYFMQKRQPLLLGKSAWVGALLIGVLVNPPVSLAGLGPMSREGTCL